MDPISILISLLVFAVAVYICFLILGLFPIDARLKQIITLIVALIFLVVLLRYIGLIGHATLRPL